MYRLLLSWRYLRTRYIALASIISVTLGVATLIVVNSVMAGFSREMLNRLHGILSDIVVESHSLGGLPDAAWHEQEIRKVVGDDLVGVTPAVHVPAMLSFRSQYGGQFITRQITLIGIDDETYAQVSDFSQYLLHAENRKKLSFQLREQGYDVKLPPSGWAYRRFAYDSGPPQQHLETETSGPGEAGSAAPQAPAVESSLAADPYARVAADPYAPRQENVFDPAKEQWTGVILGIAVCSIRRRDSDDQVRDYFLCRPGDDVQITFPNASAPDQAPRVVSANFTVVDLYESRMSEYDAGLAFVPLSKLQDLRGMFDPASGVASVTSLNLKLRPGADLDAVRDKLRRRFPADRYPYRVETWRDMQGPLLAAVRLETTILNILLFLIIAVAGFGILATFFMIVVEKTRDIGILKALGAPSGGVMSIFISYGFSLGLVGSGVGMLLGLLFVHHINDIASALEWCTGREVFDPTVYYFQEIPTIIEPLTVLSVVAGAVLIAVLASVLPALRAARLHPVEALRYE